MAIILSFMAYWLGIRTLQENTQTYCKIFFYIDLVVTSFFQASYISRRAVVKS